MRCLGGFVLFVVLYFSSCIIFGGVVRTIWIADGYSESMARAAENEAKRKWHALIAVGTGAVSLALCNLPKYLVNRCKQEEWYGGPMG